MSKRICRWEGRGSSASCCPRGDRRGAAGQGGGEERGGECPTPSNGGRLAPDLEDVAAYDRAVANDDGVRLPAEVAYAIAKGVHPVRAWRKHRKRTQDALAIAAGVGRPFISQIEGGRRDGSMARSRNLERGW